MGSGVETAAGGNVKSVEIIVADVVENDEVVDDETDSVVEEVEKLESSVEVVAEEEEAKLFNNDTESEVESVL